MSKTKQPNIVNEAFYFIRQKDKARFPRITVSLIQLEDGAICRGMAICSFSEPRFILKKGLNMSRGKAVQAAIHGKHVDEIVRDEAYKVINECNITALYNEFGPPGLFKGGYAVLLNDSEQEIFKKALERKGENERRRLEKTSN